MNSFAGASAIVTGAASGIGLALSKNMLERGAHVWMTDIDGAAVTTAADSLGSNAHALQLDVRDAAAVARVIDDVIEQHGRLDFIFNNAGIGVGGEAHELGVEHYDHIIDINIRGVTNGVAAAYPKMVAQGHGHIVNTASAAGLIATPLLVPYAMTKHAVVGLGNSLRIEAANFGVRVSTLCPTAIETPLLDSEGPAGLSKPWRPNVRRFLTNLGGRPYPVDKFAQIALDDVQANCDVIVVPKRNRIAMLLNRLAPGLVRKRTEQALATELRERPGT